MGKNQVKLLKARYLTDIVARWKEHDGEIHPSEIEQRLAEFKYYSQVSEHEYATFVTSVEDAIYESEIEFYKDKIKHKHEDLLTMRMFIKTNMTEFGNLKPRLQETLRIWEQKENDELFETQIQLYQRLLTTNKATLDDIHDRIEDDVNIRAVKRRLYATVELWARERKGPVNGLDRLAKDNQNIHTFAISNQTNDMLKLLSKVDVPHNQKTMQEIKEVWLIQNPSLEQDMRAWANTPTVIEKDDFLYRNTLRSTWAKIKTYPADIQKELAKRLYEECVESIGMCAQGHISRLTNVFVGFDEKFVQPESLQDRMAKVSLLEISEEQKKAEATKIMDQMNVPLEHRQVWLDAF